MPDTVTPHGPLPGDFHPTAGKYSHDTDCLYWVRKLYSAYGLVGQPLQPFQSFQKQISAGAVQKEAKKRRHQVDSLLQGSVSQRLLGMALGVTLDWIIHGWIPKSRQFGRKIFHDGNLAEPSLYGDGKYNTLYILLNAFRWTQDQFYLDVYNHAMTVYEGVAITNQLGGLFPTALIHGGLPSGPFTPYGTKRMTDADPPYAYDQSQDIFLDIAVTAHQVTSGVLGASAGHHLQKAQVLGESILKADTSGIESIFGVYHGIVGRAFLHLALAPNTLMKVRLLFPDSSISVQIDSLSNSGDLQVLVPGDKATIYMDVGSYQVSWKRADGSQSPTKQFNVAQNDVVQF